MASGSNEPRDLRPRRGALAVSAVGDGDAIDSGHRTRGARLATSITTCRKRSAKATSSFRSRPHRRNRTGIGELR